MELAELARLKEIRLDGETINETRERIGKQEKCLPVAQENPKDDFLDEEMIIPRFKIIQPTSVIEGATEGRFYCMQTSEEREKLEDVAFLIRRNGRTLFPEQSINGDRLCWSFDGMFPAREDILQKTGQEPKCDRCVSRENGQKIAHCEYAAWRNTKGEPDPNGSSPPICKESIALLGIDKEFMPFMIIFHGMGIPAVKKAFGFILLKKKQAAMQGRELRLRDFRLSILLQLKTNDRGKFYVPLFASIREIESEEDRSILSTYFDEISGKEIASEP